MIDLHFHVLPGIDDGPATIEDTLALGRAATAAGTQTIVATPHVSWDSPNRAADIAKLVGRVQREFAAASIDLEVRPGAEVALTLAADLDGGELAALTLGGGPWLLVECPFTPSSAGFEAALFALRAQGHQIVLAHPERCPAFARDPGLLDRCVSGGMLTSITAGSLVGRFGGEVKRFALGLVGRRLVHNVASDAHDDRRRPPGVFAELEEAGLGEQTHWLTQEVPAAILAGAPIPPRPRDLLHGTHAPQRRWWRRER